MENRVRVLMPGKEVKNHVQISAKKFHEFWFILYMGKCLGFFPINLNRVREQSGKQNVQMSCHTKTFQAIYR